jgi:caffeoyl-CoA O-methyltransferase
MTNKDIDVTALQQHEQKRQEIEAAITRMFALEDDGLRQALEASKRAGLPQIHISPIQGKLLQLLAITCNARKILEIGSLAGYSGIWLARALPSDGRLISLEIDSAHAEIIRQSFANAGVGNRTEVRVGAALELLPALESEVPFDLVFIDADKPAYPHYLEWALRLTRPGSIIVADNTVRSLHETNSRGDHSHGLREYNELASSNPQLVSLALAIDNDNTDGFTISVVRPEDEKGLSTTAQ